MADDGLYAVKLLGEKGSYQFRGSDDHGLRIMCEMLSDLTGYREDYLRRDVLRGMGIGEKRQVRLADSWDKNTRPTFIVTRTA